jgi:DNA-binding MarR family transcriptional regulator
VIRTLLNLLPQARIRVVHGCSRLAFALVSHLASTFVSFSSTLRTSAKLFHEYVRLANAVFLALLILLVMPIVGFMELRHLRYFAAVAAHGSFSRAANHLHLTQPALSRQVKSLEDEIGVALVVRGHNTISLTSAGEDFYEEAKDILARVDVAVRRIKTRPPGEKLRIGYVHSLTAGIMPRVVERFQSYNKEVFLELSDLTGFVWWV